VAGRALAFADPAIVKMARDEYVAVAGDDWYQRRRQDDEGKFFRGVADQGPRKGEGGSTRQGIYVFTASGKLLVYRNHQDPDVMRSVLSQGLKAFGKLPADERRAGALKIDEPGKIDAGYHREPPKGGLVVNVFTRILDRKDGELCAGTCGFPGGDKAARDHLWLTADEWKSLVADTSLSGKPRPVPERVVYRLARFHLVDSTRGEPPAWRREDVRKHDLTLKHVGVSEHGDRKYELKGSVLLATSADPAKADRGYDVRLFGYVQYNARKGTIEQFEIVALGEHWGQGAYTRGARPGKTPLGVAFALARGDRPADRVPPQGARELTRYLHAEK
jgi:hypothetical protein